MCGLNTGIPRNVGNQRKLPLLKSFFFFTIFYMPELMQESIFIVY